MDNIYWPDQIDAHRLLAELGEGRTTTNYKKTQKIFNQGEDADFVFFVQEGRVTLTVSEHGMDTVIGEAHEGQFFGEACLHDVPIRLATATAVSDCRITAVTKAAILSAINARPSFAKLFIGFLLERNKWIQKELLDHLIPAEPIK